MSTEVTPIESPFLTTQPEQPEQQGEHTCPDCGRNFVSAAALGVHALSHNEKQPCPDCGEPFIPGPGMSRHRQAKHGAAKANGQPSKQQSKDLVACPECGTRVQRVGLRRHLVAVHGTAPPPAKRGRPPKNPSPTPLPTTNQEAEWHVDDIFNAVVHMMWPGGEIPVTAIGPLVRWREQTQQMLQEVRGD